MVKPPGWVALLQEAVCAITREQRCFCQQLLALLPPLPAMAVLLRGQDGGASNMEERCCQGTVELLPVRGSAISRPGGTCVDARCYQPLLLPTLTDGGVSGSRREATVLQPEGADASKEKASAASGLPELQAEVSLAGHQCCSRM
jgi:hypothetical protein